MHPRTSSTQVFSHIIAGLHWRRYRVLSPRDTMDPSTVAKPAGGTSADASGTSIEAQAEVKRRRSLA
jgi:hypothetical protein